MKRMVVLAFILIGAAVAVAQMPPHGDDPLGRAADYLQLTAEQRAQWTAAHADFMTSTQSLLDQRRTTHQALDALFAAKSTDACAIGNAALAVHAVDDQLKAAHEAFKTKLESYLTADQKPKFEAFAAAVHPPEGHGAEGSHPHH